MPTPLLQRNEFYRLASLPIDYSPIKLLIRRAYSKSYHSGRALTQVIILQLPYETTPEGVTLYLYALLAVMMGIEPTLSDVTDPRFNQLNYTTIQNNALAHKLAKPPCPQLLGALQPNQIVTYYEQMAYHNFQS